MKASPTIVPAGYRFRILPRGVFVRTPEGDIYRVDANRGTCSCPAGIRGKNCKHLRAVRGLLEAMDYPSDSSSTA